MTFFTTLGSATQHPIKFYDSIFISLLLSPIILLALVYFFESYERNSYFSLRTTLYSVAIGIICAIMFVIPPLRIIPAFMGPLGWSYHPIIEHWYIFTNFAISLVFSVQAIKTFHKVKSMMPPHAHKYLTHMVIALIMFTLGLPADYLFSALLEKYIKFNLVVDPSTLIFTMSIQGISQIYFAISYGLLTKYPGWLQVPRIHKLLVMRENGITLFSHTFDSSSSKAPIISGTDDQLFGGFLNALKGLIEELAGKEAGDVQEIKFRKFTMLLEVGLKKFIIALLADSPTVFAVRALKSFTNDFSKEYGDTIDSWNGDISKFQGAKSILDRYFKDI